ncbi:MAG: hypothetical protein K2H53_06465 [Clostridia bacterium]|nr:hypothetical protein [Clostridia bacterium]
MLEKAVKFLEKYVADIMEGKEELKVSYDLWEMHEGVSIYSIACIFAAYEAMLKVYEVLEEEFASNRLKHDTMIAERETLNQGLEDLKNYVVNRLYDEEKKSFVRNENDKKIDISLLGLVTPFNMFSPKDKKIVNTIERINMTLRTYTSGYLRFEWDHYTEDRPWVIATLWMALYYIEANDVKHAKECFDFVVNSGTEHGFLAEQVENSELKSVWVIGLAWSHAMFVIVLEELIKLGAI